MATTTRAETRRGYHDRYATLAQKLAALVGAVFLIVGIAGFIPGITTNYDDLSFADHTGAELLGLFEVNVLHNIVHLAFGIAGFAMAARYQSAVTYLIGGGLLYALVAVFGFLVDHEEDANFLALNDADNWLHVALAAGMVVLGLIAKAHDDDHLTREPRSANTIA